ncbi:hypothetical protein GCM10010387_43710 [Streptomyces inusitatus]|uniref:Secreted protein n=1 Tax=Streptomyces inusitatus TaxID=68221 RepID=A0A918UZC4_9ACTN|nr:hypothetical protein [Streptomyces inusitatus]GGZ44680.1 hypothetical protein GCM10010387_43710 [Streptomyces inusitatus]
MLLTASALALILTSGYALLCAASPFRPCRPCSGTGVRHTRKAVNVCRRCRGRRHRLRTGRRILNAAHRTHTTGNR